MPRHRARGFDVRRVYEDDHDGNGYRVLVDRLWPRGMKKDAAALDDWAGDAAPSVELRRWYGHDRSKFEEFVQRYREELARPPASDAVARLRSLARGRHVTLLTATRDVEHSGANVPRDHLVARGR
jgi:uncharacterized protein YeaO (DUF488 family)